MAASVVFEHGKLIVQSYEKEQRDASSPPRPLLIVTPTQAGRYPVILFLHGFAMQNNYYGQLLRHVASHGYIVVAPQMSTLVSLIPSSNGDLDSAAAVSNWLPEGLPAVLPDGVKANLLDLVLAGHSRGGHSAFALAQKSYGAAKSTCTNLNFSALVGIDPVAGVESPSGLQVEISPRILTHEPNSFDVDMPVLVIGTGLGGEKVLPIAPPCAPEGLNHAEFFRECRAPCSHFVVKEYGHLDLLDDDAPELVRAACKSAGESRGRDLMRRSIAGLVVAFLEAYIDGKRAHLDAVVRDPGIAPATLDPVEEKSAAAQCVVKKEKIVW